MHSILCSAAAKAEIESGRGVNSEYRLHPIPQNLPKNKEKDLHFCKSDGGALSDKSELNASSISFLVIVSVPSLKL